MRSSKTYYLPEHVGFYSTNSSESLVVDLARNISEILDDAIKKNDAQVLQFLGEVLLSRCLKSYLL